MLCLKQKKLFYFKIQNWFGFAYIISFSLSRFCKPLIFFISRKFEETNLDTIHVIITSEIILDHLKFANIFWNVLSLKSRLLRIRQHINTFCFLFKHLSRILKKYFASCSQFGSICQNKLKQNITGLSLICKSIIQPHFNPFSCNL